MAIMYQMNTISSQIFGLILPKLGHICTRAWEILIRSKVKVTAGRGITVDGSPSSIWLRLFWINSWSFRHFHRNFDIIRLILLRTMSLS